MEFFFIDPNDSLSVYILKSCLGGEALRLMLLNRFNRGDWP